MKKNNNTLTPPFDITQEGQGKLEELVRENALLKGDYVEHENIHMDTWMQKSRISTF